MLRVRRFVNAHVHPLSPLCRRPLGVVRIAALVATLAVINAGTTLVLRARQPYHGPGGLRAGPVVEGIAGTRSSTMDQVPLRRCVEPESHGQYDLPGGLATRSHGEPAWRIYRSICCSRAHRRRPNSWQDMRISRGFIYKRHYVDGSHKLLRALTPATATEMGALAMEADRMVNSRIAREDLDTEMTGAQRIPRWRKPPAPRFIKGCLPPHSWHNYGNSTIGNRSDIENVGIDNLRAFYRTYYQPDNAETSCGGQSSTRRKR